MSSNGTSTPGARLAGGRDGSVRICDAAIGQRVSSLTLNAPATRSAATQSATAPAKKAAHP